MKTIKMAVKMAMAMAVVAFCYQVLFVPSDAFKGFVDDAVYEVAEQEQPAEEAPAEEAPAEDESHEDEAPAEDEKPAEEAPAEDEQPANAPAEEAPAEEAPADDQPAAPAVTTSETREESHDDYQQPQTQDNADDEYVAPSVEGDVESDIVVLAEQKPEGEVLADIAITDDATEQVSHNYKLIIAAISGAVVAVLRLIAKAIRA